MSADRELLELAAKAAGYEFRWGEVEQLGDDVVDCTDLAYIVDGASLIYWAPQDDDGDSRRLQVACGIDLEIWPDRAVARWDRSAPFARPLRIERNAWHEDDGQAARWAVLRAAAEMGRRMP